MINIPDNKYRSLSELPKLPSFEWQYQTTLYNSFNNELMAGHNQGLALYDYDTDTKLYKNLDLKPIDTSVINFDDVNKKLEENYSRNDDLYNNAKASVSGAINGAAETISKPFDQIGDSIKNTIDNISNFFTSNIKTYLGLFILFFIILKKI